MAAPYPSSPASHGLPSDYLVAAPADGQVLHRIVRDPPEARDFGPRVFRVPRYRGPAIYELGVSMFATEDQARSRMGRPGAIARVVLPPNAGVHVAKTLGTGHYTVWGDPDVLAAHATVV